MFPERPARSLADGAEASFIVLDADPALDIANLRRIHLRVKRGEVVRLTPPAQKPSVAEAMVPLIIQGNLVGAFAVYDSLKLAAPDQYDFSEQALNQLGYAALNHGQARRAVAIFERNAELFPRSANVYDSLADAWLAAGDTTKAVAAYRSVIENLPKNAHYSPAYAEGLERRAREWLARTPR
jgi:tetratricopeptide (TPR) repeat protein